MWTTKNLPVLLLSIATALAGKRSNPDLEGRCCRVWSAARGCIEAEKPKSWTECHDLDNTPANMPADCAIMILWSGECVEKKDGREDGWNGADSDAAMSFNSAIQAAGTLVTMYHHYTATYTATTPTEIRTKTTVVVKSTPVPTKFDTVTVTEGQTMTKAISIVTGGFDP